MKTKYFALTLVSLMVIFAVLLTACGPAATPAPTQAPVVTEPPAATEAPTTAPTEAPEPVTIKYWHTHSDAEAAQLDKVIAAFEAANPGIKVEMFQMLCAWILFGFPNLLTKARSCN